MKDNLRRFFTGTLGCVVAVIMIAWALYVVWISASYLAIVLSNILPPGVSFILPFIFFPITIIIGPLIAIYYGDWFPVIVLYVAPFLIMTVGGIIYGIISALVNSAKGSA